MSLIPARRDFTVWKGTTLQKHLLVKNADETPMDLSDYDVTIVTDKGITLSEDNNTVNVEPGVIDFILEANITETADWRSAKYELVLTNDSSRQVLLWGYFRVKGLS